VDQEYPICQSAKCVYGHDDLVAKQLNLLIRANWTLVVNDLEVFSLVINDIAQAIGVSKTP
jgi:hypothetical protein